ncbi:50S ribosomal protein L11 methyltransferase [Sphingobacterium rhinopitheci]|uniref:50S ribosomal protein L11 methyltransferase n=1 Tax=Sphingobacterium rhinopitheci TaxID=2781960 RepID=UPI001F526C52|nr:50S ribosomal protein L11 methyltransferase [Sphingobacterium rhinopitheci]MCI0919962.1 50S ribosomal protein L11 methyltransferase [Sphingobacterium rhinopitheci]
MKYTVVNFFSSDIQEWQKDLLIDELGSVGFDTFEDQDYGFSAYIPSSNLDIQALETVLLSQVDGYQLDYKIEDIEEQNWNVLWESNFNPIIVDDRIYVRATFHEALPSYDYEIVIDPKMSFGTGHHQTTSMMLSYILENDFKGKRVLDMGCGTGILAILASKRGAASVVAIDFDSICFDSVIENRELNNVTNIEARLGSKEAIGAEMFDSIIANINRNILLDQLETYAAVLKSKGELYLSGFYEDQDLQILKDKCESLNIIFKENKVMDNWCAAKFVKQ